MKYKKGDKFIFEISDAHTSLLENENYYSIKQAPYISFSETTLNKFEKIKEEKYRPSELEKFQQEAFEKGMEEAWKIAGLISKFERDGVRAIVLDFDGEFVSVWTENRCAEGWAVEKVTKIDAHCDLMPVLEFIGKR